MSGVSKVEARRTGEEGREREGRGAGVARQRGEVEAGERGKSGGAGAAAGTDGLERRRRRSRKSTSGRRRSRRKRRKIIGSM